jgi:uncharacterized membrane protein YhiD involved in acid resistance
MDYNEILTTLGITQGRLETIIIFTTIAIGIGLIAVLYWKFLMAGFFALVLIFVFSRHEPSVAKTKTETVIEQSVKSVERAISSEEREFMDDCLSLADKKDICEDLWKQRQTP